MSRDSSCFTVHTHALWILISTAASSSNFRSWFWWGRTWEVRAKTEKQKQTKQNRTGLLRRVLEGEELTCSAALST
ncbi:hypothetical protein BJX99DRAFT_240061 [Aspergillus californicus]